MTDSSPIATPTIPPAEDKPPKHVKKDEAKATGGSAKDGTPPVGPKGPGTTGTASGKPTKFHRDLAEFASIPALAFEFKGDHLSAYIWTVRSQPFAYAVADLAEHNPALKRWILRFTEGGVYGQVIWTGLCLIVPILANYGLYPQGFFNPFALSPQEVADYQLMMAGRQNGVKPFVFQGDSEGVIIPTPID